MVVARFLDPVEIGSCALRCSRWAVGQVALPALSGLQAQATEMRRSGRAMLGMVLAVNGTAALVMVLDAPAAVDAVAGEPWLAAGPVLRILAIAMWARAIAGLTGQMLDAARQPAQTLRLKQYGWSSWPRGCRPSPLGTT